MTAVRRLLLIALAMLCGLAQAASSYTFRSDSYAWETAANSITTWDKTCTSYPGDDDKATITLTGGFKFNFAGTNYTSVRVLTNGGLQFGTDTGFFRTYTNTALPAGTAGSSSSGCVASATTNVILAYWTDLNPSQAGSGGVTWEQKGTAPNRYLVVSWNGVYQYNTSTPYTFQIILYENGEFKYQYGNANATGSKATIGVQVDSSDYTQYSYNSGYNANGSAIRWFVPSGTPTRRAEYRFDEYSYSGRVGEVVDSSGNSNNGVRIGTATTLAGGYVCRGLSILADTTSASNAVDTLLDVNSAIGDKGAVTFWYAGSTSWNNSAAMLLDGTTSSSKPFFLVRQSDGSLRFTVTDSGGTVLTAVTTAQSVSAGTWKHIAVSWRLANGSGQSSLRIYINGVQAGAVSGTTTGSLDNSIGTLFVGDNRAAALATNATNNSANGTIDEMRVYNYEISALELTADMAPTHTCPPPLDHVEAVPSASTASTCAPTTVTVRACSDAACNTVMTGYLGTVNLSTSSGRGVWSKGSPTPLGALTQSSADSGSATYTFVATDQGVAKLQLAHGLSQAVSITAVDSLTPSTSSTSSKIQFSDNAFVWTEAPATKIGGGGVAVAGRTHNLVVSLWQRDPSNASNPSCTVANFSGNRNLKLWRTDTGGSFTAPTVVSPALTVPASRPSGNNVALTFTSGVANLSLSTTDIGRYTLNLDDDSLVYASATVSGSFGPLTVRPFAVVVSGLTLSGTGNPGGSGTASDAIFGKAGAPFSATIAAYRWSSSADTSNDGSPDSTATLAQVTAGGLTPGFGSTVNLTAVAASQTPTPANGGVLGTLSNNVISGFSGGTVTVGNLSYSEVGSFQLNTSAVVGSFLSSGLALDAVVFDATGAQQTRVGRFVPAGFAVSGYGVTHRNGLACSPASTFTYLDENLLLAFTLTAQNAAGVTTKNYVDTFAKLPLGTPTAFNLAGISGTTMFKAAGRLSTSASTGAWATGGSAGTAAVTLTAKVGRGASVDGPFDTAQFGIAPVDSDNVGMLSLNLDTDSPANGADSTLLGTIPLRYGRLRLQNGMSAANRTLNLPLTAQYWSGSAFVTNTLDSCTRITSANLSFGNFRKTLTSADAVMSPNSVTVNPTQLVYITLAAPGGGRLGSMDVALALSATSSDQSCLKTPGGWTASVAATSGANLAALQGAWCSTTPTATATKDPSARATWGLYRGSDGVVYQRENY